MNKRLVISYCLLITCVLMITFCSLIINQLFKNQGTIIPISLYTILDDNQTYYLNMHPILKFFYLESDIRNISQMTMRTKNNGTFLIYDQDGFYAYSDTFRGGWIFGNSIKAESFVLKQRDQGFFRIASFDSDGKDMLMYQTYIYFDQIYKVVYLNNDSFRNQTNSKFIDFIVVPNLNKVFG